jgi:hypothetical protein
VVQPKLHNRPNAVSRGNGRRTGQLLRAISSTYSLEVRGRRNANAEAIIFILPASAVVLAACTKSPGDAGVEAAQSAAKQAMAPHYPKDASAQAERMVALIQDRPECDLYKGLLRDAGRGPPAVATTRLNFIGAYDAASKAGCVKAVR